jgi:hypothetical protein
MKQTLEVIGEMEAAGVIGRYAISGAVAAFNYVEAAVTKDLDILVSFDAEAAKGPSGLISLAPIYSYLRSKGYEEYREEGIMVGGWPVQFLPVADALDAEALAQAQEIEVEFGETEGAVKTRVLRPEHLVAIALRVGRPKDLIRIAQFLEEEAADMTVLCDILDRHKLSASWRGYCARVGIENPCPVRGAQ